MKKVFFLFAVAIAAVAMGCEKSSSNPDSEAPPNSPRTEVPAAIRGKWMYGAFSMNEYWTQNPQEYIGNGFEIAMAFSFDEKGNYTEYFTSSYVLGAVRYYQQAVTKGTVEVDAVGKTIKTHPFKSHYKLSKGGQVYEEADTPPSKLKQTLYYYSVGEEPNGTKAIYLKLNGTSNPLTFLSKQ